MINKYRIPDLATKYILFQRTQYLNLNKTIPFKVIRKLVPLFNYNRSVELEARIRGQKIKERYLKDMEREYLSIKDFLPAHCLSILDIGCGVAGIDIFLNRHYSNSGVAFYLFDKTEIAETIYYNYEEQGAFYNSLEIAKSVLVYNYIEENNVHLVEALESNEIKVDGNIDLVLSLISWGFHYPVSVYLEQVYKILNENGVLILDVRKNTDGLDLVSQKFGNCNKILEDSKYIRVRAVKQHQLLPT